MTVAEAIRRMIRVMKISQAKLAEKAGKSPANISAYIRSGDGIKLRNLMSIADACDYDIVLVRKGTRLPYGVLKLEQDSAEVQPAEAE